MTTIGPFAAGTYRSTGTAARSAGLRAQFDDLSTQLATGKAASTYAGLGQGRGVSLDARSRIAALTAVGDGITRAESRVKLASLSLTQVSTNITTAKSALQAGSTGSGTSAVSRNTLVSGVAERLASIIDALNQQADGRSLFAGRATDVAPVAGLQQILDGDGGLDGVKALIAERKAADLGAGATKTGRLTLGRTGATVGLAEPADAAARANFGFTILSASSSNTTAIAATSSAAAAASADFGFGQQPAEGDVVRVAVTNADGSQSLVDLVATANPPAGSTTAFAIGADAAATAANLEALLAGKTVASAQSADPPGVTLSLTGGTAGGASFAVNAQPAAGDTVSVTLGLRDGTTTTLTLKAGTAAGAGVFAIGATPDATAENLRAALATSLDEAARGPLAASSALRASQDFFAGSTTPGLAARRIAGSPETATGFEETAQATTLAWYRGEVTADPRGSAAVPLGDGRSAKVGATADEPAFRNALAAMAAMAGETFDPGSLDDARFTALSTRVQAALTPKEGAQTVADVSAELSRASADMATAQADRKSATAILQDAIDGVEGIDTAEVAQRLVDLQTRLQASYQTTAMLSRLSLVNFL
jgi:flagellar hook-associated protein 3 FlgL